MRLDDFNVSSIKTASHEARFEEILGLSLKCVVWKRKIGLEGVEKNEGWAQDYKKHSHPTEGL